MKAKALKNKSPKQILGIVTNKIYSLITKAFPSLNIRRILTATGYALNQLGITSMVIGRKIVRHINKHITDNTSDSFVVGLSALHQRISEILKAQKEEYGHYAYFSGYPYQSLGILGIYGERASEERFDHYSLQDYINKDDYVLDIGCNCGFMSILTTYRTGARCHGVDINPYMTDIGMECAKFLKISDKIKLEGLKFQDITGNEIYTAVYSFATHWTDDGNYRVALKEHLEKIHMLLKPAGTLVFETHCADVGDETFYRTMNEAKTLFSWNGLKRTDNNMRELYIMKKI